MTKRNRKAMWAILGWVALFVLAYITYVLWVACAGG
jgi:hypothetical protein